MAIAFRSVGTRLKADVSQSGGSQSVALPAGHVSGDYLILFVVTDDNTGPAATPSGWTKAFGSPVAPGTSSQTPYSAPPRVQWFARVDNGALGSSVLLTFDTSTWPTGNPYVLAWTAAYSGVDTTAPVEQWWWRSTAGTTAAQAGHAITTTTANDWILTFRASSAVTAATFTDSVGTDAERVDDTYQSELSAALYDSNTAVAAGAQTVRTTTSSVPCDYGSVLIDIVLKAPASAGSTTAAPPEAGVAVTAYDPAVVTQDGPWDLCGMSGLPQYQFAVDWNGDGVFSDPTARGDTYASDTFSRTVANGWGTADTWQTWTATTTGGGTLADYSVGSGTGVHTLAPNSFHYTTLPSPAADVDVAVDFSTSALAAGDSQYVALAARYTDTSTYYFARIQMTTAQAMVLNLRKRPGGSEVQLSSFTTALTHAAGTWYTVRLRVAGSTLWAKVWAVGTAEPDWQTTVTDTDVTAAGSVGVRTLLGSASSVTPVAFSFDNFRSSQPLDTDDVTPDIVSDVSVTYGRDQERQLAPAAVGSASFSLNNAERTYSPENSDSPLSGDIDPARTMRAQVSWNGQTYPLFRGRIEDYTVKADFGDRTVDLTFLDGMNDLSGHTLSTGVYASMRTGTLINTVLDAAGWTGDRDIDPGATVVKYWWVDATDALTAIQDLVKSEGPPAVAYAAPDGTFVFRDRHHRLLRQDSRTEQAYFHAGELGECTASGVPQGALSLARPFVYAHGWKDIVNSVTFDVSDRAPSADLTQVWQDATTYTLALGQSLDLTVSSSDPFVNAVTPVLGTDILYTGAGTVGVLLSRTSGASAKLTLQAIGGTVSVSSVQVRAQLLSVQQTYRVSMTDAGSITRHGERTYPNEAPWAGTQDAQAIASMVLLHYATRRPTVQIRVASSDPAHFAQVLSRTVSDRVRIVNDEMGLDDDFFVERVTHTVQRTGQTGRPPVHAVVLGCEKDLDAVVNPFTFDKRGAGFDQGVFDPLTADDASQVFIFDDPAQGRFDTGKFGT